MKFDNYQRATSALAKIGYHINHDYFNGSLPTPVITVQEAARSYGHFTVSKVWHVDDKSAYEINVSANYLDRPIENVVTTLIHEFSHMYAMENGIKDVSNNGTYHNKKFKDIAENMGHIKISQAPVIGWSVSDPTEETIDFCIRHDLSDFTVGRGTPQLSFGGFGTSNTGAGSPFVSPKKTHHRKYICACGQTITATKELHAMCMNCGSMFVEK